ncbi:hypothetical protein SSX86_006587 [Deinandra increscens subsp. villosa]|uniref:Reverse transcriptase zinc-binding domain-containing protein n=1 Tax=Deinandra increscens subsp. villosa TaxID=3103831 RepID=A0AAP0H6Y0_9ASTR
MEEVKMAIWDCDINKAPGPDGFNSKFLKTHWDKNGPLMMEVLHEFHETGQISLGCNASFIALIPKKENPLLLTQFRPITLVGSIYKTISKVLANRLKSVLNSVISETQSAYVNGRSILDGVLILNETMCFPEKWRLWIMGCLASSHSSVLVNGSPTDEFQHFRGVRQGDPLSPFLFILGMEALHIASQNANRCFHLSSGLQINFDKSKVFGIGLETLLTEQIANALGCQIGKLPFTYLGLPIGANMGLVRNWVPVIDKVKSRLNRWKALNLSQGAWIAWDRILAPKECGGLGIGGFKAANLALLSRWGWKFKADSSTLWCQVIKAIHSSPRKHEAFPLRKTISGYWKPILTTILKLPEDGVNFVELANGVVGTGTTIKFWQDSWLNIGALKDLYPALYIMERNKSCSVAERFQMQNGSRTLSWRWNKVTLSLPETALVDQLTHRISQYNFNEGPDKWIWFGSKNRKYSTSSVRKIIESNLASYEYKHKWFNWVPKKANIFTWKAALEKIPVKMELRKRSIEILNSQCSWCNTQDESVSHALLQCCYTLTRFPPLTIRTASACRTRSKHSTSLPSL